MKELKTGNYKLLKILAIFSCFYIGNVLGNFSYFLSIVHADEFFKFAAPKTETKDIKIETHPQTPSKPVLMKDIKFENAFTFNPAKGEKAYITYTLSEPGFAKIRVLRRGTRELFLNTIVNLEYRVAGTHTEMWDGRDYWGNIVDFSKTPYDYLMETESLATYSPQSMDKGVEYEEGISQKEVIEESNFKRHIHGQHEQKYENIPLLTIVEPKPNEILKGKVVVKSFVDKERRGFGDKYGYGIRYYVDDQIVHEEFYKPESGGNFLYKLDTTAFADGKHLFYIGLCDHNDHVTSQGFDVVINNSGN